MTPLPDLTARLNRAVHEAGVIWHRFERAETDAEADEYADAYTAAHERIASLRREINGRA